MSSSVPNTSAVPFHGLLKLQEPTLALVYVGRAGKVHLAWVLHIIVGRGRLCVCGGPRAPDTDTINVVTWLTAVQ